MAKLYETTLFIFHRDLRLCDNSALISALSNSKQVIPCFILDRRLLFQTPPHLNAIHLICEALQDLDTQLQLKKSYLHCLSGISENLLQGLLSTSGVDAVFLNRDYTPFSRHRDMKIQKICEKENIPFLHYADALLNEPEIVQTTNGEPYRVFTPFFHRATQIPVTPPKANPHTNYVHFESGPYGRLTKALGNLKLPVTHKVFVEGSRAACERILKDLSRYQDYMTTRDIPSIPGTTRLSPYLRFGLCSIREVHAAIRQQLGISHPLIRQLYWREFYIHLAFHFPYVFKRAFKPRYESVPWSYDKVLFQTWCEGRTGFPIVDAGMRELNATGWMHNRVRMIVASFLAKDLHIDWRWGERYFAEHLVDYDPAVNNGNWQWSASTGADAQPYFRIFNPWLQQEKYDKACEYIKRWIPELSEVESKIIHQWFKATHWDSRIAYPKPIIDHKTESQHSKELFTGLP
ncbi:MAG: cryptochrome/photolyase family protein [Promethearchaeota archaeon]